jgi:predicted dehydrogenase
LSVSFVRFFVRRFNYFPSIPATLQVRATAIGMPDPLLADMSIHHFDLMRMVLGDNPKRVSVLHSELHRRARSSIIRSRLWNCASCPIAAVDEQRAGHAWAGRITPGLLEAHVTCVNHFMAAGRIG